MIKKFAAFFSRFSLFFVSECVFFTLGPWLTCRPIATLGEEKIPHDEIPSYAQCYYINHGQIVFLDHPPLAESPFKFALYLIIFVVLIGLFFWSGRWSRRSLYNEALLSEQASRGVTGRYLRSPFWIAVVGGMALPVFSIALQITGPAFGILLFSGIAIAATALTGLPDLPRSEFRGIPVTVHLIRNSKEFR